MSQYDRKYLDQALSPRSAHESIERQLIQAYIKLEVMAPDEHGYRTVVVGPFGDIDVQLTDLPRDRVLSPLPPLWLEVFSRHDGAPIDSDGCSKFGTEELTAVVEMIRNARRYDRCHD